MKPSRTHNSNVVFRLPGGNENNDLWGERQTHDLGDAIRSVWVPTPEERERIANGENIALTIWGYIQPPVAISVTDEPLGRRPGDAT